jgi:hypothetical protein
MMPLFKPAVQYVRGDGGRGAVSYFHGCLCVQQATIPQPAVSIAAETMIPMFWYKRDVEVSGLTAVDPYHLT